jgi:hypothetical protein
LREENDASTLKYPSMSVLKESGGAVDAGRSFKTVT